MEGPLWDAMEKGGYSFPEWVTKERLFDLSLLEFQAVFWQINGDIQEIEKVLAPADDDRQEKTAAKNDSMFTLLLLYGDPSSYSHEDPGFSYYAGALINEGNYAMDFSCLRAYLKKPGWKTGWLSGRKKRKIYLRTLCLMKTRRMHSILCPGTMKHLMILQRPQMQTSFSSAATWIPGVQSILMAAIIRISEDIFLPENHITHKYRILTGRHRMRS